MRIFNWSINLLKTHYELHQELIQQTLWKAITKAGLQSADIGSECTPRIAEGVILTHRSNFIFE